MFPDNLFISSVYLHGITSFFLEYLEFVFDAVLLLDSAWYTRKSYLEMEKKKFYEFRKKEKNSFLYKVSHLASLLYFMIADSF